VHVAEALGAPLHMLYTVPWMPTSGFPHPWARAFDASITYYITAAAGLLLRPAAAAAQLWLGADASARWRRRAMARVQAAANRVSTPLLDGTAWWGIADLHVRCRRRLGLRLLSANMSYGALYRCVRL
jgi:hypothetical protein